jgi:glutamate-ammonia-ligase adenylyltransferase
MTDVEWVAQLLVLEHAHEYRELRSVETLEIMQGATRAGLMGPETRLALGEAWEYAWQIRRALFLWKGREGDVLPSDRNELHALAQMLEGDEATAADLQEKHLRLTRHARHLAEQVLFG